MGPRQTIVPTEVEVSFFVPGFGATKEKYRLGFAEDQLCWGLNERLSKAIQTSVRVTEMVSVPKGRALHMERSRSGMQLYIRKQLAERREKINRGKTGC